MTRRRGASSARAVAPYVFAACCPAVLPSPHHAPPHTFNTVTSAAMRRFLHVANGTCTTRTIEAAGIPGACSIWADPLYDGPVPGGLNDTELLDVRMRYLAGPADLTWVAWAGSDPSLDTANDLRQWRATIERHE